MKTPSEHLAIRGHVDAAIICMREAMRAGNALVAIEALSSLTYQQVMDVVESFQIRQINQFSHPYSVCNASDLVYALNNTDAYDDDDLKTWIDNGDLVVNPVVHQQRRIPGFAEISWHENGEGVFPKLFGSGVLRGLRYLKLSQGFDQTRWEPFSNPIVDSAISTIADADLPLLRGLSLNGDFYQDSGLSKLFSSPLVQQLESLELTSSGRDGNEGLSFLQDLNLPELQSLKLTSLYDSLAVLSSVDLPKLKKLKVTIEALDDSLVDILMNCDWFEGIEEIRFSVNVFSMEAFRRLASMSNFKPKKIHIFAANPCDMNDQLVETLIDSKVMEGLESLSLYGEFTDAALRVIAPLTVGNLRRLELRGNLQLVGNSGLTSLAMNGESKLEYLHLGSANLIDKQGLCAFSNAMPHKVKMDVF